MVHPSIGWTVGQLLEHLEFGRKLCRSASSAGKRQDRARPIGGRALQGEPLFTPAHVAAGRTGPALAADPPSHRLRAPDTIPRRFRNLLDSRKWHPSRGLVVSDFYFDQCLAYAQVELDDSHSSPAEMAAFTESWLVARSGVVSPKLLIFLGAPPSVQVPPDQGSIADNNFYRQWSGCHESCFVWPGARLGPVLFAGSDRQSQIEEISAAIRSMQ